VQPGQGGRGHHLAASGIPLYPKSLMRLMTASTGGPPRGEAGGPPGPAEPLQEQHPEGAEEHEHEFDSASTRTTCTCRWSRRTPAGLGPFLDGSGKDRTDSNQPWAGIYLFSSQARRRARAAWLTPRDRPGSAGQARTTASHEEP